MKIFSTLFILLNFSISSNAQKFPNKFIEQPDGITISYSNLKIDTCLSEIFIGDSLQIIFPCYSKQDYRRVDISVAGEKIKRIKQLVTFEFLESISECCSKNECPDTNDGYFLILKKGDQYKFIALDIKFSGSNKCGSASLLEIIKLMNEINSKYH